MQPGKRKHLAGRAGTPEGAHKARPCAGASRDQAAFPAVYQ